MATMPPAPAPRWARRGHLAGPALAQAAAAAASGLTLPPTAAPTPTPTNGLTLPPTATPAPAPAATTGAPRWARRGFLPQTSLADAAAAATTGLTLPPTATPTPTPAATTGLTLPSTATMPPAAAPGFARRRSLLTTGAAPTATGGLTLPPTPAPATTPTGELTLPPTPPAFDRAATGGLTSPPTTAASPTPTGGLTLPPSPATPATAGGGATPQRSAAWAIRSEIANSNAPFEHLIPDSREWLTVKRHQKAFLDRLPPTGNKSFWASHFGRLEDEARKGYAAMELMAQNFRDPELAAGGGDNAMAALPPAAAVTPAAPAPAGLGTPAAATPAGPAKITFHHSPKDAPPGSPEAAALASLPNFMDLVPDSPEWKAAHDTWQAFIDTIDFFLTPATWATWHTDSQRVARTAYETTKKKEQLEKYPKFTGLEPDSPEWRSKEAAWGMFLIKEGLLVPSPKRDEAVRFMQMSKDLARDHWRVNQALGRGLARGAPARPKALVPESSEAELSRVAELLTTNPEKATAIGQAMAQQRYLKDALDKDRPTGLKEMLSPNAAGKFAKAFMEGAPQAAFDPVEHEMKPSTGQDAEFYRQMADLAPLVRQYNLTPAELFAIRAFTADDYKYLNPAVAVDDKWMYKQMKQVKPVGARGTTGAPERAGLHREGQLHGGSLMQALSKLDVKSGTTYRGARVTPTGFQKRYAPGKFRELTSFQSTSTDEAAARGFADNSLNQQKNPKATVSVMVTYKIIHAYDIAPFSAVATEKEWLLAPGSEFEETGRKPTKGNPGRPPFATEWWELAYTQTKGPPRVPPGKK